MLLKQNCLHYYINSLRMPDHAQRSSEQSESAVQALHNVICTMRFARHDKICGEDFSNLDFGNIPLNNIHWSMDGNYPCSFRSSLIKEWCFMSGHFSSIFAVAWSPDGKYCLTCGNDNIAIIWDTKTGLMKSKLVGHESRVTSGCFSKDGKRCITGSADSSAKLWNCETGECIHTMVDNSLTYIKTKCGIRTEKPWIHTVSLSPDERYCMTGSATPMLWDLKTGECEKVFIRSLGTIISISFLKDGDHCIIGSSDGTVKILSIITGVYLNTIVVEENARPFYFNFSDSQIPETRVDSISLSSDEKYILVGKSNQQNGYAEIWDLELGRCVFTLIGHTGSVDGVAFSPDGKYCLTGSTDKTAKLWNAKNGELLRTLTGHQHWINSVAFSHDSKYCLTGSHDNNAVIWDVNTGQAIHILRSYLPHFWYGAMSPQCQKFIIGSEEGIVSLWNLEKIKHIMNIKEHKKWVQAIAFSSDRTTFLTCSMDGIVKCWSSADYSCIKTFECEKAANGHASWIESIDYSPDGRSFLTCSHDKTAKIWDFKSGKCLKTITGHTDRIFKAKFSADGKYVITASEDQTAILWNVKTEKAIHELKGHQSMVYSSAISPSGNYALTGDWNGTAILWDLKKGKRIYSFEVLSGAIINTVSFSDDEKLCFTGTTARIAKLWIIENGECYQTISLPQDSFGRSEWFLPFCITNFFYMHKVYEVDDSSGDLGQVQAKFIDTLFDINDLYIQNCNFKRISTTDDVKKILFQYGGIIDETGVN